MKIAPLKLRHAGAAAGATGEWLFSFITVFAGGIALQNVGWKIWIWMALSCALAVPFVWFCCPEVRSMLEKLQHTLLISRQTTGKSLEEIDLIFAKEAVRDGALASEIRSHHWGKGTLEEAEHA
jgi:hypothetical protein